MSGRPGLPSHQLAHSHPEADLAGGTPTMPSRHRPALRLDALEPRTVPSGDVAAALARVGPGQYRLTMTGDAYANDVVINQAIVSGRNGTTLNGGAAYDFAPLL